MVYVRFTARLKPRPFKTAIGPYNGVEAEASQNGNSTHMPAERLQKIIAAAGIASRRKAEELISAGHVKVNGTVVTELGTKADADTGPYVLNLKNASDGTLKVTAKVLLSVYFHADSKSRNLPEHAIDPGQVWTIPGLASSDKVTISASGYAPLELTVP